MSEFEPDKHMYRFLSKVVKTESCWVWQAATIRRGYGEFWDGKRKLLAHRWIWSQRNGEIPPGHFIDHMCRNPSCVNPDHLRAVTPRVNALENNNSPTAINHRKTHCKHGHEFSGENLIRRNPHDPRRVCRECKRASDRRQQLRHGAKISARNKARYAAKKARAVLSATPEEKHE